MCLAIPGKILSITGEDLSKIAQVSFSGITKEISIALVPEAKVDDYVIVHAGVALNLLDEEEAGIIFKTIKEMEEAGE
jgi:hydrogenase expression/formation protein HypC